MSDEGVPGDSGDAREAARDVSVEADSQPAAIADSETVGSVAGQARDTGLSAAVAAVGQPGTEPEVAATVDLATEQTLGVGEAWANYANHSRSASDRARHLALAGIALIWILSGGGLGNVNAVKIDGSYTWPLYILIVALVADFAQYVYLSIAWRLVAGHKNKLIHEGRFAEANTQPSRWTMGAAEVFFVVKLALVAVGYVWLLLAAGQQLLA